MGLLELFEIGVFTAFWNWSNIILTFIIYFCVALGVLFQYILEKKCRKSIMRWALIGISAFGIVVSECAWQIIIGWDRIAVDIIYGLLVCLLMGNGIAFFISSLIKKRKQIGN